MQASLRPYCLLLLAAGVPAGSAAVSPREPERATHTAEAAAVYASPAQRFLHTLRGLCGKAFAGRVVADSPASADDPFANKPLVMHVRECADAQVRIPFHVGDDRSRTWVLTYDAARQSLQLKHDHRHADGSSDPLTLYGGDSRTPVSSPAGAWRVEFPADAESKALFRTLDRAVSVDNVWAMELDAQRFVYELARPQRLFRVEFDLTRPQPVPPPPWGAGGASP
ncbi:MAG: hypothetical protein AMXMBFR59_32240 [Rhodanobacteraceae bacterium]